MSYRMTRARSIDDWGAPPRSGSFSLPRRPRARWLALAAVGLVCFWWSRTRVPSDVVDAYNARLGRVLEHPHTPQRSFREQLADNTNFIISMPFGGQGNQFLAMMNMLYIAKHTGRVAIMPPANSDVHFASDLANYSALYDFPRFYRDSAITAVQLSQVKTRLDSSNHLDSLQCWSTMEIKTAAANDHQVEAGWNQFKVFTNFWAVPHLPATRDGRATLMDPVLAFLKDGARQEAWLDEVQRDLLPQIGAGGPDVDRTRNVKAGFDPVTGTRPTASGQQVMCLDSAFWLGDESPPLPYPQGLPHDAWRVGKAWKEVGRYLHFTEEAERYAGSYLERLLGVKEGEEVPPFIGVHIRRTDFKSFKGNDFTPLASYAASVENVRTALATKLAAQSRWNKPRDRPYLQAFPTPPSEYKVLVATDEEDGDFRREVEALGWVVINHRESKTVDRLGPWWPSVLDSEMLGRAQGFVGTEWSTFSMLAELRVQYWRGGVVETADPRYSAAEA